MKRNLLRIIVMVIAAALVLGMLIPALTGLAMGSITQDDIDKIQGNLDEITAQKKEMQEQLDAIRGDMSKAKEQVELINSQLVLIQQEIAVSNQLIDQYDLEIQDKEEEIAQLEETEAEQYEKFCSHVRWMEETGSMSYLSIIFQAGSFSELLDYAMLVADIMAYSNEIIGELKQTQSELSEVKDELQTSRDEQKAAHEELKSQRAELEASRADAEALYSEIAAAEAEIAAKAQQLAADEAEIEEELRKAELEYAEQIGALQNNGEWYWPLPGIYYISSIFGGRYHPIYGNWETHTGTDIPAPRGTEIHAAQAGVVTTAKYNVSYGYYCIVTHANGRATLYAHMKQMPIVKVGQTVEKGQVIGYVGSTGDSTGNHLHFELRVNGDRQSALTLYPHLPYTGPYVSLIKKQLGIS